MSLHPIYPLVAGLLLLLVVPTGAQVLVNQSGYNTVGSKRFTAPLAADGTPFVIAAEPGGEVVYAGEVAGGAGDFTAFEPAGTGNFRVLVGAVPEQAASHAFGVGPFWMERVSYRRMIQFFIDSRSGFGDATSWDVTTGRFSSGIAWRDSHQFSFELRTLIQWYASNPDAFGPDRMPVEGTYAGMRDPLPAATPEIVRLIHWGVELYLRGTLNHTLVKEELAYFLYYYPLFQEWIPVSLYEEARDYLFPRWGNTARDRHNWYDITHTGNLFQTYTVMGGTKGSFPPGHSVVPNLLMHAVAVREGRTDAAAYLEAARNQAQWIVNNLDPANPIVTKGQRMSEHILVPALVEFQMRDPSGPVTGVDAWLGLWTDTVIARSANLWDFRKYSETVWTPENVPGGHPWWNEPGNIAGFPASALAAATRMDDPAKIERLRAIAISQNDQIFGRNPHNRHFSFRATQAGYGFEGVETGWFSQHLGGLGILENARGVLDASVKHPAFPYNPDVAPGYVEGWVAFNSAWNAAMAWAARDRSTLRFLDASPDGAVGGTGVVTVELVAPLNFSRSLAEPARVRISGANGEAESLALTETGADTSVFRGTVFLENTASPNAGDGAVQAIAGSSLTVSYAHDIFARTASAVAADTTAAGLFVTPASLPVARVGQAYGPVSFAARNATGPVAWQVVAGGLPPGLELTVDGLLRGTPTGGGVFPFTVRAEDADSSAENDFTLSCSGLAILTSGVPDAIGGQPYEHALQAGGGLGNVVWSLPSGAALPSGLSLDPAGVLSGTLAVSGPFPIQVVAADAVGATAEGSFTLQVLGAPSGRRFIDTFESDKGGWFKAAPATNDALGVVDGALNWKETGGVMSEAIGRSFPSVTLAVGQKLRLSFDYRQAGTTTDNILRAGLYEFAHPVAADNWAGANAIGSWKGYATFIRDNAVKHLARVESAATTSANYGPNNGSSGVFSPIGENSTPFDLDDTGQVTYQGVFEVHLVSANRMNTLFTLASTNAGGVTTTHLSVPGAQTSGAIHSTFNAIVLRHAGGSGMPATFDNIRVDVVGGTNPAWFTDWQDLTWPGAADPAVIGAGANPDGDPFHNFQEWAMHLDPNRADVFRPTLARDGDYLLYSYERRKTGPGQVAFHVEWSDSLAAGDWSEAGVVVAPPVSLGATRESVACSIPRGQDGRRFIRLRMRPLAAP